MSANETTEHDLVDDERVETDAAATLATETELVDETDLADESDDDAADDGDRDEGDIAADYIEELLDIADIDGDLEIDVTGGRTYISVTADGESNLERISSPEVVDALQQVTRLAVQAETGEFSRLILDIGGSRDARQRELEQLVDRAVTRIEEGAATAALPPMSSYERKLVHDIAAARGYDSESEGEGRKRHTVLRAK
ncbi:Jag family protein [Gulosibacter faecalis]|jgi:spoIIIJ-associated protein|uniref:Protein jag n=1 Tax=Gulosibacter faecalis TaxID=272240 RepID=A0ABW5UV64_9MICO|nr:R3H domain-containing nucleic acid-binding protein [Gulosibacter faecalis]